LFTLEALFKGGKEKLTVEGRKWEGTEVMTVKEIPYFRPSGKPSCKVRLYQQH